MLLVPAGVQTRVDEDLGRRAGVTRWDEFPMGRMFPEEKNQNRFFQAFLRRLGRTSREAMRWLRTSPALTPKQKMDV
jgi:hypothetical protein